MPLGLLRLCHDRRRHQREGQRKHCGSEPTPRPDRHGTLLYVIAFCCCRILQHWRKNARAGEPARGSDGTARLRAEVWAIGRVKTMGASPKSPSTTWEWLLPGAQSPGQRDLITVLGRPQWSEPARSSKRAKPGSTIAPLQSSFSTAAPRLLKPRRCISIHRAFFASL
jgi:hypothetical protein